MSDDKEDWSDWEGVAGDGVSGDPSCTYLNAVSETMEEWNSKEDQDTWESLSSCPVRSNYLFSLVYS